MSGPSIQLKGCKHSELNIFKTVSFVIIRSLSVLGWGGKRERRSLSFFATFSLAVLVSVKRSATEASGLFPPSKPFNTNGL